MEFLGNEMEITWANRSLSISIPRRRGRRRRARHVCGPVSKMVGSKARLLLNADGKVEKVLNLDEW